MFFDWKGTMWVLAAICAVIALCALDLNCSRAPEEEEGAVRRVKGELSAWRQERRNVQADDLARMARDLRVIARRHVERGENKEAQKVMAEVLKLEQRIERLQNASEGRGASGRSRGVQ